MSDYCIDVDNSGGIVIELARVGGQGAAGPAGIVEVEEHTHEYLDDVTGLWQTGGWGYGPRNTDRWHVGSQADNSLHFVFGLDTVAKLSSAEFAVTGDADVLLNNVLSVQPKDNVSEWLVWQDREATENLVWQYNTEVMMILSTAGHLELRGDLLTNQTITENEDSWFFKFNDRNVFELTQTGELRLDAELGSNDTL